MGWATPTKGISYRIKHMCEPDPRAHLKDLEGLVHAAVSEEEEIRFPQQSST